MRLVRLRQPVLVVDEEDDLLGKGPQLGDGALRVGVGVLLGESAEVGQILPTGSQKLKVLGLHTRPSTLGERSGFVGAA